MSKSFTRWVGIVGTGAFFALACGSDSESDATAPATQGAPGASAGAAGVSTPAAGGAAPAAQGSSSSESGNASAGVTPLDGVSAGGATASPAASSAAGASSAAEGGAPAGAAGGTAAASPFPSDVTRPKIMIVGDSISAGPGCYKKYLLADLNAGGYTNFDFVGEYTDDCAGGTVMHSARSCTTALDYTQPTFMLRADCGGGTFPGLSALMTTHQPDLLMLQLGVNDVWNGLATDAILANYATLIEQARAVNPDVVIAIAQIQQIRPMQPDSEAIFARAQQLIEAVPAWAAAESEATSPVFVADLWTNSDTVQTLDGVHPDDPGAQRMGQNWFEALKNILPAD